MNGNLVFYSRNRGNAKDARFWPFMTGATEVADWGDMVAKLRAAGSGGQKIGNVNLYAHGAADEAGKYFVLVGSDQVDGMLYKTYANTLRFLRGSFAPGAVFTFDVCAMGHAEKMLKAFSEALGIPVRGYRDLQNPNWLVPQGEGPSKLFHPDGRVVHEGVRQDWMSGDDKPIVKGYFLGFEVDRD